MFEARGDCANNEYRYAAYTAVNPEGTSLTAEQPEFRAKQKAQECPYFEFCYGGALCLTGTSDLGTCPAIPYLGGGPPGDGTGSGPPATTVLKEDIPQFCADHY